MGDKFSATENVSFDDLEKDSFIISDFFSSFPGESIAILSIKIS